MQVCLYTFQSSSVSLEYAGAWGEPLPTLMYPGILIFFLLWWGWCLVLISPQSGCQSLSLITSCSHISCLSQGSKEEWPELSGF